MVALVEPSCATMKTTKRQPEKEKEAEVVVRTHSLRAWRAVFCAGGPAGCIFFFTVSTSAGAVGIRSRSCSGAAHPAHQCTLPLVPQNCATSEGLGPKSGGTVIIGISTQHAARSAQRATTQARPRPRYSHQGGLTRALSSSSPQNMRAHLLSVASLYRLRVSHIRPNRTCTLLLPLATSHRAFGTHYRCMPPQSQQNRLNNH